MAWEGFSVLAKCAREVDFAAQSAMSRRRRRRPHAGAEGGGAGGGVGWVPRGAAAAGSPGNGGGGRRIAASEVVVEGVDFDCFHLCHDCHYLNESTGTCDACGQGTLLDLSKHDVADRLREIEDHSRLRIPAWARWAATPPALIVFLAIVVFTVDPFTTASGHPEFGWFFAIVAGLIPAAFIRVLTPRWLTWWWFKMRGQPLPARWRYPLAGSDSESNGEELVAPFSGQPCDQYRIVVVMDRAGDSRPAESILDEVGSTRRPTTLEKALDGLHEFENVEPDDLAMSEAELVRFLRERGLFVGDGELLFLEARQSG